MCNVVMQLDRSQWRHQMKTFSALLVLCVGNSPVTGDFPSPRPVTRSFVCIFYLRMNKRLGKNRDADDLRRHRAQWQFCNQDMGVLSKFSYHNNDNRLHSIIILTNVFIELIKVVYIVKWMHLKSTQIFCLATVDWHMLDRLNNDFVRMI